jgi:HEAT repeat protein
MPQEPHVPTDKTKAQAQQAAGLGLPHEQIGALLGISDKTLRKYYEMELALGRATASAQVAKTLFNKAIGGDTTAAIWWTKAQMNWSEKNTTMLANPDGSALDGIQVSFINPKSNE